MRRWLRDLAAEHPEISDVCGRGAMLAIEIVLPATIAPDPGRTERICGACRAAGLVT